MSAAAVHKQYDQGVDAFRRQIGDEELRFRFSREVDAFMRACALGVWSAGGENLTSRHVEYYNAIYTRGNPAPSILFWELSTAVCRSSDPDAALVFRGGRQGDGRGSGLC